MSNYRFMRLILFFDLPVLTAAQRREYRKFVKLLKKSGFLMMQESVYVKMCLNDFNVKATLAVLENHKPKEGSVATISVTEKQFSSMTFLVGDFSTDIVDSDERYIEL